MTLVFYFHFILHEVLRLLQNGFEYLIASRGWIFVLGESKYNLNLKMCANIGSLVPVYELRAVIHLFFHGFTHFDILLVEVARDVLALGVIISLLLQQADDGLF